MRGPPTYTLVWHCANDSNRTNLLMSFYIVVPGLCVIVINILSRKRNSAQRFRFYMHLNASCDIIFRSVCIFSLVSRESFFCLCVCLKGLHLVTSTHTRSIVCVGFGSNFEIYFVNVSFSQQVSSFVEVDLSWTFTVDHHHTFNFF